MKKILTDFAAGHISLAFGACSTSQLSTAQQLFASEGSVVTADLQGLTTSTLLDADQRGRLRTSSRRTRRFARRWLRLTYPP